MSRINDVWRMSVGLCLGLWLMLCAMPLHGQEAAATSVVVPPLVSFSGVLTDLNGKPLTGIVGVTFALYNESQGGAPLWLETQNVSPDKTGHYTVTLGATASTGLPSDIFAAGEARWLGVRPEGQQEQPRVLLLSVPYALKAGDAQTIGGLPPSAFVQATPGAATSGNASGAMTSSVSSTARSAGTSNLSGKAASAAAVETQNYVAKFVNATGSLGNSLIFDNGTSIGIGTSKPTDALDVVGGAHLDFTDQNSGTFGSNLAFGDSTSGEGISSARQGTTNKWGLDFWTYKQRRMSITSTGLVGIGTATPADALDVVGGAHLDFTDQNSGTFGSNLAFGDSTSGEGISSARQGTTNKWGLDFWTYKQRRMSITSTGNVGIGTAAPAAMLEVNGTAKFDNLVSFASSQTFPGTITSITVGSGLTVGASSGAVTLGVASSGVTNSMLADSSLTVTAGTGMTGGGAVSLGGSTTLNVDTTKVPLLNASNAFYGQQTVDNTVSYGTGLYSTAASGTGVYAAGEVGVVGASEYCCGDGGWFTGFTPASSSNQAGTAGLFAEGGGEDPANGTMPGDGADVYGGSSYVSSSVSYAYGATGLSSGGGSASGASSEAWGGNGVSANGGEATLSSSSAYADGGSGLYAYGGYASNAGGADGGDGVRAFGSNAYSSSSYSYGGYGVFAGGGNNYGGSYPTQYGGTGVLGYGGTGSVGDGVGGVFEGANSSAYGDGLVAWAGSGGIAGDFSGNVSISGSLSKSSGSFKIDHPLDPANKYLYHSFVESPDMKNIYDGVATLDESGEAVIQMPAWFGALNRDFRYQLTCIGGFAPVYIGEELANNQFKIAGGKAGMKVSWQITGIRQDPWANAHRIPVEEQKEAGMHGFYIHPELYGAPREKQIEWARHPQLMRDMAKRKAQRPMRPAMTKPQPPRPPVKPVAATRAVATKH